MNYLKESERTVSNDNYTDINQNIQHGIEGITTEVIELLECFVKDPDDDLKPDEVAEELGDIFWYMALICREYNWTFNDLNSIHTCELVIRDIQTVIEMMVIQVGGLVNIMKRAHFYKKHELDKQKIKDKLMFIYRDIKWICNKINMTEEFIQELNINKLRLRYPDKFTSDKAINRDVEKEHKFLQDSISKGV